MIPEEMLSDEVLRQAAEKCAEAIIASLPAPEECNHKFSGEFEEKMQSLIRGIGTKSCAVAIQDSVICKQYNRRFGIFQIADYIVPIFAKSLLLLFR